MADFALVLFESEDGKIKSLGYRLLYKAGFYKSGLGARLFLRANDRAIRAGVKKNGLFEGANAWIIKLPVRASLLDGFNRKVIKDYVERLCTENGLEACFMPPAVTGSDIFKGCSVRHGHRDAIFKSHLQYILDDIYEKNGIRLGSLDTVIVADEEAQEVYPVVKLLEPNFRYLTIAAANDRGHISTGSAAMGSEVCPLLKNSGLEERFAEMSGDTGLMINISSSWKTILKSADLVINLSRTSDLSGCRMKNASLVININGGKSARLPGENAVINGIEYLLPAGVFAGLGTEVLRSYSKKEITETVLDLELGGGGTVADLFERSGCRIVGYTGRRGLVKAENVIKTVIGKIMPVMG